MRIVREVVFVIRSSQTLLSQPYMNTNNKAAAAGVGPIEIAQKATRATGFHKSVKNPTPNDKTLLYNTIQLQCIIL